MILNCNQKQKARQPGKEFAHPDVKEISSKIICRQSGLASVEQACQAAAKDWL